MRTIIIEGPDGSGKSTLGRKLGELLGYPLTHTGGPPPTKEDLERKLRMVEGGGLFDRTPHISESVYSRIANGRATFLPLDVMLDRLVDAKPILIYARRKGEEGETLTRMERVTKDYTPKGHKETVEDRYLEICNLYDRIINGLRDRISVIDYDYTRMSPGQVVEAIEEITNQKGA